MGIRFSCPNGHKLHVKEFLAGKRAVCPNCGAKVTVPAAEPAAALPGEAVRSDAAQSDLAQSVATRDAPFGDFGSVSAVIPTLEPPPSALADSAGFPALADSAAFSPIGDAPFPAIANSAPFPVIADAPFVAATSDLPPPEATPLVGAVPKRRRNQLRTQLIVALLLTAILIVVMCVMVWVLMRNSGSRTAEPTADKSASIVSPNYADRLCAFLPIFQTEEGWRK